MVCSTGSRGFRALVLGLAWLLGAAAPAAAQFLPYYGKNKVKYNSFAWRVYRSPHFEVFYYPEFEEHLPRVVSYAESAYQKISVTLKHNITFPIPLVLYKTHSDFEQTGLFSGFLSEGIAAFAEHLRHRLVLPIDEAPDRLYGLLTHELTHIFAFDLIPRSLTRSDVALWIDEGLADYMRGLWDPLDLMTVRDAAVADQVPRISRLDEEALVSPNPRLVYNLGHAAFEYMEARYGKEGIRQFLFTLRKNASGGNREDLFRQAFRATPSEFDDGFEKWLKERFKPHRDRQPTSDFGRDLAPDDEKTRYTQVFAFSPSPSGEVVAAVTGNRADGEADLVLLSARDGSVVRNLTEGFSGAYEDLSINDGFTAGRSIAFSPDGDYVAFFARRGRGRSLFLVSVLTGETVRRVPVDLDLPQAPCLLPDGERALLAGLQEGVSDIFLLDLATGRLTNLTQDAFRDSDPSISPDGTLVAYSRRVSGHEKLVVFPLAAPQSKTQVTFGVHDDLAPIFSPDGKALFYASNEEGEILNVRSLDLSTGAIVQHTDALGGTMAPAVLPGGERRRVAFISYSKGRYRLQALDLDGEAAKEVDQAVVGGDAEPVDFEPELKHEVLTQNKRGMRVFEKFTLDRRPPINVGLTSGGDFFGGSQLAFSDILGDKSLTLTVLSEREFRNYDASFVNLSRRLHWGLSAFDLTLWGYADPYGYLQYDYSRRGALLTRRLSGAQLIAVFPLDKTRRLQGTISALHESTGFPSAEAEAFVREQYPLFGRSFESRNGATTPLALVLVQETTRFREFGPVSGSTFALGLEGSPGWGRTFSRLTLDADVRKYWRLTPGTVLAARARGFRSTGDDPDYFFFGGNMELRGFDYRALSGTEGFFANAELRFPVIDLMKTPLGILGPLRGTLFAGVGGARWTDMPFRFGSRQDGRSYVNDAVFGEPVSGYHLVDARASFGWGLQLFALGLPLHFDWSRFTDLKVVSDQARFTFWIGYDF